MSRNPYMDYLKSLSPTWALGYDLSGSTWKDEGSAGADVTIYGAETRTDGPTNDLDQKYLRGDGVDDYAAGGQDGSLTGVQDGSWAFWVRTDTLAQGGGQYIYAVYNIANKQRSWGLNWRSTDGPSPTEMLSILGSDDGVFSGLWVLDVELPPADTWVHFVYVRDTGSWKVYRNGTLTGSTDSVVYADKTFYSSTSANVTVFTRDDAPWGFKGDVHTPAMWNGTALTSTQVANLYAAASETPVSFKHFLRRPMQPIGGFS